jgi:hypothetical protein
MDMGPAGPFEDPGDEDFVPPEPGPADRTEPGPVPRQAVVAALDVHKPVLAVKRGVGHGLNQLPFFQPGGTDRAGLGRAGDSRPFGFPALPPAPGIRGMDMSQGREKQGIPEPEEGDANHYK